MENYGILELQTGKIDGWYSDKEIASHVLRDVIHPKRKNNTHILIKVEDSIGDIELTDDVILCA